MVQQMTEQLPLLVICGPTGSGKTSLALSLAEKFSLEIISADSRQVYRRMNIGTAKATSSEQKIMPHHLIDLIEPDQEFSVAEFVDRAHPQIHDIIARGKLPCVVGGTGLYIRALLGGLAQLPTGDPKLRLQLHQREKEEGAGTLYRYLQQVDPVAAAEIHPHNLIRIVRALEVYTLSGQKISVLKAEHRFAEQPYRTMKLAPEFPRKELYFRINQRTKQMLDGGLIAEVEELVNDYSVDLKVLRTLGYREVVDYLCGNISAEQMETDIKKHTRQYAKRQLTWFRKESDIIWVDSINESGKIIQSIDSFFH